ncbi:ATM1-type heavy metal exporter [subsurface metagenome]
MVGERGITLSGGQKQRIAIARAFRKNSSFMIFDDSLSSVDSKTANEILKNIRSVRGTKTILLIAHRVAVLKESDIIYVFDKGNIVEKGTHFELLRQKGLYTHLWKIQHVNIGQVNG